MGHSCHPRTCNVRSLVRAFSLSESVRERVAPRPPLKEWTTRPRVSVVWVAHGRRDRIATARVFGRLVGTCRCSRQFRLWSCVGALVAPRWRSFVRLVPLFPSSYVSSSFLHLLGPIVSSSRSFRCRSGVIVGVVRSPCVNHIHFVIVCARNFRSVRRMFVSRVIIR